MTLFVVDRNIPEPLARMLDHFDRTENRVRFLDDDFDRTAKDTEWLAAVAQWDPVPVVLSGDGRILKNPTEAQLLAGLPLTFFHFAEAWCNLPWDQRAWKTIKVWPEIVKEATPREPTIFRVPVSATKVERLFLTSQLRGYIRPRNR